MKTGVKTAENSVLPSQEYYNSKNILNYKMVIFKLSSSCTIFVFSPVFIETHLAQCSSLNECGHLRL